MGMKRYWGVPDHKDFKGSGASLLPLFSQTGQAATETGLRCPHYMSRQNSLSLVKSCRLWPSGFLAVSAACSMLRWAHRSTTHVYVWRLPHVSIACRPTFKQKSYFILSWCTWIGERNWKPESFYLFVSFNHSPSNLSFHLSSLDSTDSQPASFSHYVPFLTPSILFIKKYSTLACTSS